MTPTGSSRSCNEPKMLSVALWFFTLLTSNVIAQSLPMDALTETDKQARAAIKPVRAMKIILVGDSTTQVGSGWGGEFCARHTISMLTCVNLARGGRSTFSYRAEGSWQLALNEARTPGFSSVYMLIQFGHNDQPGKPGRSTDLQKEFPANLRQYVAEARAAGAIPILVTPLTRRSFKAGRLQDDLKPWADSVISVAVETTVPLVDLHATSVSAVQTMGPVAALTLAQAAAPLDVIVAARTGTTVAASKSASSSSAATAFDTPSVDRVVFDYSHLGPKGAELFSAQVAEGLIRAVPELAPVILR